MAPSAYGRDPLVHQMGEAIPVIRQEHGRLIILIMKLITGRRVLTSTLTTMKGIMFLLRGP